MRKILKFESNVKIWVDFFGSCSPKRFKNAIYQLEKSVNDINHSFLNETDKKKSFHTNYLILTLTF